MKTPPIIAHKLVKNSAADLLDSSTTTFKGENRITLEAIAKAFGCERLQQVHRVLFGDIDVLEGESFEDHGIGWRC